MLRPNELPESWLTVHRAMQGHYEECLDVLVDAIEDDPVGQWLGPGQGRRRRYAAYLLAAGFKNGRVIMAQPRAGVCVASRTGRSWSPLVFWSRLRLLFTLSGEQRERLKKMEAVVQEYAGSGAWWVRGLAVCQPFRDRGLVDRLLRQALAACTGTSVIIQTGRSHIAEMIVGRGGERLRRGKGSGTPSALSLYRVAPDSFSARRTRQPTSAA